MAVIRRTRATVVILLTLVASSVESASKRCPSFGVVQENIARTLVGADPEARARALAWVTEFREESDALARQGRIHALLHRDLKALTVSFDGLAIGDLPFMGSSIGERVRQAYRSIGKLSGRQYRGIPTFDGVDSLGGQIGHLVAADPSNKKGVLLELRSASELVDEGVARERLAFSPQITVGEFGVVRKPDVVVKKTATSTDYRSGIHHECKNWADGLQGQGANFQYLREYADDEFPSDIVMHAGDGFVRYRVDLRDVLQRRTVGSLTEAEVVRDELLRQFREDAVRNALGGLQQTEDARTAFELAWNAGRIARYY